MYEPRPGQPGPVSQHLQSFTGMREAGSWGGHGSPGAAFQGRIPVCELQWLTQRGCGVTGCPWHSGCASPRRFLVQCLFIQASHRDGTFDPLCGSGWRRGISRSALCWLRSSAIKAARGFGGSLFSSGTGFGPRLSPSKKSHPKDLQ